MDPRVRDLMDMGERLFTKRRPALSLWQEIAENFYPHRADFMASHSIGDDFAAHLMSSYPVLAHREIVNSLSEIMRPTSNVWAKASVARLDRVDNAGKRWLESASEVQRRAMYDRRAGFVKASRQKDEDLVGIGQGIYSVELNREDARLLYRAWHPRDVAWGEDHTGTINQVVRRGKYTLSDLVKTFRDVPEKIREDAKKTPSKEVEYRHFVVPRQMYDLDDGKRFSEREYPFVSVYVLCEGETKVLEAVPSRDLIYCIPRWITIPGSQYAYSPCTVAALPDARLLQQMTLVLLEAGETAIKPPMIATEEAVRSDVQLFAGGLTWVSDEYDEKLGEALRPITQDRSGLAFGLQMTAETRDAIANAFFLNRLNLPPVTGREMTAYEVSQRVQEYIRTTLPLFAPLEDEDNAVMCEMTFTRLLYGGAFGSFNNIPDSLRSQEIQFRFESPLHEAVERAKVVKFREAGQLIAEAMQLDQTIPLNVDIQTAFRDALEGAGTPAKWIVPEDQAAKAREDFAARQQEAALAAEMEQGAGIAKAMGEAVNSLEAA